MHINVDGCPKRRAVELRTIKKTRSKSEGCIGKTIDTKHLNLSKRSLWHLHHRPYEISTYKTPKEEV